jgi:hypothetical protein
MRSSRSAIIDGTRRGTAPCYFLVDRIEIFWLRLRKSSDVSRLLKLGTTPFTMWRRFS